MSAFVKFMIWNPMKSKGLEILIQILKDKVITQCSEVILQLCHGLNRVLVIIFYIYLVYFKRRYVRFINFIPKNANKNNLSEPYTVRIATWNGSCITLHWTLHFHLQ